MEPFLSELTGKNDLLKHAMVILVAVLTGMVLRWLVFWFLMIYQKRKRSVLKEQLLMSLETPTKFLLSLLFVYPSFFILESNLFWYTVTEILIIINFAWALIASISVAKLLAKLMRIVQDEALWDKNVADLVLVDTEERVTKLRATFSVKNALDAWSLPCKTGIALTVFRKDRYPDALPKRRRMDAEEV